VRGSNATRPDGRGDDKVKRSQEVTSLFKDWKKRGQVKAPREKTAQGEAAAEKAPSDSNVDMVSELKGRSAFHRKVQAQITEYRPKLEKLATIVLHFLPKSIEDLLDFHEEIEKTLGALEDENLVLCEIENWPQAKVNVIREEAVRHSNVKQLTQRIDAHAEEGLRSNMDPHQFQDAVEKTLQVIDKQLDTYLRAREQDDKRFAAVELPFKWSVVKYCREHTVLLAKLHCKASLEEFGIFQEEHDASQHLTADKNIARRLTILFNRVFNMLQRSFEFGFRIYGYAGGFDAEMTGAFGTVHRNLEYMAEVREKQKQKRDSQSLSVAAGSTEDVSLMSDVAYEEAGPWYRRMLAMKAIVDTEDAASAPMSDIAYEEAGPWYMRVMQSKGVQV